MFGVCPSQVTAVTSELSDERFRGDAVGQALDVERAERLRLSRENKELQVRVGARGKGRGPPRHLSASRRLSAARLRSVSVLPPQARLDQCKVTMGTLEKQLEEEKQRVQTAESQRGAGTGKHQRPLLFLQGGFSQHKSSYNNNGRNNKRK